MLSDVPLVLFACIGQATHDTQVDSSGDTDAVLDSISDTDSDSDTDTDTNPDSASDSADTGPPPTPCNPDDADPCGATQLCCTPCCEAGATATCTDPDPTGACPLPDLSVDQPLLAGSALLVDQDFSDTDCAVVEGCVGGTGLRRLLEFTASTPNTGTADLSLGDPTLDTGDFHWSECHEHYHYDGFAEFDLVDGSGATIATGRKQGFCLMDSAPLDASAPGPKFNCGYQGISMDWTDIYQASLDCQWLDVTDVPAGEYTLRVTVNPDAQLRESDLSNNSSEVTVSLPEPSAPPVCPP